MRALTCLVLLVGLTLSSMCQGAPPAARAAFTCTLVFGFSQTRQWFDGGFESEMGSSGWERFTYDGGSIGNWAVAGYAGWSTAFIVSGCPAVANSPDRIVLNVSGDFNNDPSYWATQTSAVITLLRARWPSATEIVLQAVVGGPGDQQCVIGGNVVRAAYNKPFIRTGLATLVGSGVSLGPNIEVASCADYADDIGHLQNSAFADVSRRIALFYQAVPTPTTTLTPAAATRTPTPTATPVPTATAGPSFVRRFNAGGPQFTGLDGRVWRADAGYGSPGCGFIGGARDTVAAPIANTADQALYQSSRHWSELEFRCDLANAVYDVVLHFAETDVPSFGSNRRLFHVSIEGQQLLAGFDVYSAAGPNAAASRAFVATVQDAQLNVELKGQVGHALLSAVEVLSRDSTTPTPTPTATLTPLVTPTPTCKLYMTKNDVPQFVAVPCSSYGL